MKRIHYFSLLILGLLSYLPTLAQSPAEDFKYGLKLNNRSSFNFSPIRDLNGNVISGGDVQLLSLSPAFVMRGSKGNFWDFSLQNLQMGVRPRQTGATPDFRPYYFGLTVKGGFFYTFAKSKVQHWLPMLGLEVNPSVSASQSQLVSLFPTPTLTSYKIAYQSFGATAFITPRVMWLPGKRFFMDAGISIPLMQVSYVNQNSSDPLGTSDFSTTFTKFLGIEKTLQCAIGIGIKL
jgi:hypothetical protein